MVFQLQVTASLLLNLDIAVVCLCLAHAFLLQQLMGKPSYLRTWSILKGRNGIHCRWWKVRSCSKRKAQANGVPLKPAKERMGPASCPKLTKKKGRRPALSTVRRYQRHLQQVKSLPLEQGHQKRLPVTGLLANQQPAWRIERGRNTVPQCISGSTKQAPPDTSA